MTNKIEPVKEIVRTRLIAAGIKRCLDYPEQIDAIGNFLPMAFLRSGNTPVTPVPSGCVLLDYALTIYIISQTGIAKTKHHENLIFACAHSLMQDLDMGGTAYSVNLSELYFNDSIPYVTDAQPQNSIQTSSITLSIQIKDSRL